MRHTLILGGFAISVALHLAACPMAAAQDYDEADDEKWSVVTPKTSRGSARTTYRVSDSDQWPSAESGESARRFPAVHVHDDIEILTVKLDRARVLFADLDRNGRFDDRNTDAMLIRSGGKHPPGIWRSTEGEELWFWLRNPLAVDESVVDIRFDDDGRPDAIAVSDAVLTLPMRQLLQEFPGRCRELMIEPLSPSHPLAKWEVRHAKAQPTRELRRTFIEANHARRVQGLPPLLADPALGVAVALHCAYLDRVGGALDPTTGHDQDPSHEAFTPAGRLLAQNSGLGGPAEVAWGQINSHWHRFLFLSASARRLGVGISTSHGGVGLDPIERRGRATGGQAIAVPLALTPVLSPPPGSTGNVRAFHQREKPNPLPGDFGATPGPAITVYFAPDGPWRLRSGSQVSSVRVRLERISPADGGVIKQVPVWVSTPSEPGPGMTELPRPMNDDSIAVFSRGSLANRARYRVQVAFDWTPSAGVTATPEAGRIALQWEFTTGRK